MKSCILVLNAGSSSLKYALYDSESFALVHSGENEPDDKIEEIFDWITKHPEIKLVAAGHRVVHGGRDFHAPVIIDSKVLKKLTSYIPLAPLHQPHSLKVIKDVAKQYPKLINVACFDTSFHRTQSKLTEMFAIPQKYTDDGVIRYGFHGLSYEYIASRLPAYAGEKAKQKVIVSHLGNGASMCAMNNLKSVATTMGFTALEGLMMGTRCGNIDPGVILYLVEEKGLSIEDVSNLLYKESGLKGVSGISNDVRTLVASEDENAKLAIELFCFQAAKQLCSLLPSLGGLDILVFTAGIGENSPKIREGICKYLACLGVAIDGMANKTNMPLISHQNSKIDVYIIPTNEELMIARGTGSLI